MEFKVIRIMQYTEEAVVEAEDWDALNNILQQEDVEYTHNNDDVFYDQHIKQMD